MKSARLGRGLAALGAIALALAAPARDARANGAFPASGQILVDPAAPETIWVATTYGFAKTKDAGATFHLVCEAGIRLLERLPPPRRRHPDRRDLHGPLRRARDRTR